jgi:hypothetical protein
MMQISGSAHGNKTNPAFMFELPISLIPGTNDIALLSVMVGLPVNIITQLNL